MLQLRLEGGTAVCDVLLFLLLLEPLANLAAGLAASGNLHPVPAGTLGVLGGEDLHDVAVFQHMVQRDDPAVHLGAHHPVAHGGVDGVGKVDGRGAGGQVLHVAARCEDEHLIGEHIDLQRVDIVLCVRALLVFQQTADPLVAPFGAGALAVLLVFPVGGHAVLGDLVHLLGADLHLEGQAVRADDRGVEGLISVGLWSADIVLEAAQNGLVEIMDDTQNVVAVPHRVHNHPEGEQVEDLVQALVLVEHLPVDGVGMLHPAVDDVIDVQLLQPVVDLDLDAAHEVLVLLVLGLQLGDDFLVANGVQIF